MGGTSQTTQSQQSQNTNPWGPSIPGLENLIKQIRGQSTSVTPGQQAAIGSMMTAAGEIPNMGPNATSAIQGLYDSTNGVNQTGMWNQAYGNLMNTLSPYYNPNYANPFNNPGFQAALDTMNQDITKNVKGVYAGSGRDPTGAGSFAQSLGRGLSQGESGMLANEFNTLTQDQINAVAMGENAAQQAALGTTQLLQTPYMNQIAAMQQSGQLPGLFMGPSQAAYNAANLGYQTPFTNISSSEGLQLPIAGMGGSSMGYGTSTTNTAANPFSSAIGAGLGLLSLMPFPPSDEKVKENIEPVGLLHNGLNIYKYNYKGDHKTQIGVMAQEVEKVKPEAVADVPVSGAWAPSVKAVNYDLATK